MRSVHSDYTGYVPGCCHGGGTGRGRADLALPGGGTRLHAGGQQRRRQDGSAEGPRSGTNAHMPPLPLRPCAASPRWCCRLGARTCSWRSWRRSRPRTPGSGVGTWENRDTGLGSRHAEASETHFRQLDGPTSSAFRRLAVQRLTHQQHAHHTFPGTALGTPGIAWPGRAPCPAEGTSQKHTRIPWLPTSTARECPFPSCPCCHVLPKPKSTHTRPLPPPPSCAYPSPAATGCTAARRA